MTYAKSAVFSRYYGFLHQKHWPPWYNPLIEGIFLDNQVKCFVDHHLSFCSFLFWSLYCLLFDYLFGIFWSLYCLPFDLLPLITSLVFFGHCIVCPLIYCLWLPLWYLLVIVLSALWFTASDYLFGIFWSLYCLPFDLLPLITSLVSFGHCIVCPLIYCLWLPLWYFLVIVLSALWFTASDYLFGIFWSLYCLPFDLLPLITSLVSFGHCFVCPLIYCLWLPLWYFLVIVLSALWFTASDYLFGIFWSLYCLPFDLLPLITSLVSFGHCIVCPLIYCLWLPLWYFLVIVLSALWFTASDYLFGIFWSLYCLPFDLLPLITSLVFFGHCIVCPLIYCLWLPLWYLLVIVLSALWFTASDYLFGIFWSLFCLPFDLLPLITSLVFFGHCIVCPLIYCLWLPLWYLLVIVLSALWFTASDYLFGIFWSLYCLPFDLLPLITSLVSFGHCIVCPLIYCLWLPLWYLLTIVLSSLWFTASDYLFGIFWSLYCLPFDLLPLITSLVSFGHCIVCPLIYCLWLPLWYLLVIVLSVLWFTASDYLLGIFWSLYCLPFDLLPLITSLVSFGHCIVCPLIYCLWLPLWYLLVIVLSALWFTASDYLFGIFWSLYCLPFDLLPLITSLVSFGHCIVCSLIYCLWLPLWYLLVIVLSALWFTASDYLFGIFWSLYCLLFDLLPLITSLVSVGHCIVCSLIYCLWLPLWYLLVIVLSALWLPLWYLLVIVLSALWFTASDYLFGICWSLYCLPFDLLPLITSLVSFDHCIVCSLIYCLWLPLWYLLVIVLSALWFTASDYLFGICWSLYCLLFDLLPLITSLVSFGHCIVCSLIYCLWLPLWYLLVIVLSALWFTASDYLFGIFWSLYCLLFDLLPLITSLVSFGHCIVCPLIYCLWLPLWYLLTIVLSALWFTASDYLFGICWSLYCLLFDLLPLITSLVSFDHCIVCSLIYCLWLPLWYLLTIVVCSLIYCLWLLLWYLLVIVLSALWFTASDYLFGICWSLYCLPFDLLPLITSLVSFGHCIVCPLIYCLWLPLWYLLVIVLSALWFTASDYLFGICWSLYCLPFDLLPLITSLVSVGHCIVCPLIYCIWLPLWYL